MNQKTGGAVSGAVSGAKVGGIPGAIIGGILGAARAGNAIKGVANLFRKNPDGTLQTPDEQMKSPQEQLWDQDDTAANVGGDMLAMTADDQANIAQGIDNGYGDWG